MRTRLGFLVLAIMVILLGIVMALNWERNIKVLTFEDTMEPIPFVDVSSSAATTPPDSSPVVQEGEPKTGETRVFADIEFVWIPPGSFQMGSPSGDTDLIKNELPQHQVTIPHGFWLGKYEVTQAQWEKVMGSNPSSFKGPQKPVESIFWDDCQKFIKKMNELKKGTFRLPSEAEWEYACRAGTTTKYYFGDDLSMAKKNMWYKTNSYDTTHPVGQLKPNSWGLYDMHGNVSEYCQDCYHDNYTGAPIDGSSWESLPSETMMMGGELIKASADEIKMAHGGCWFDRPRASRAAFRGPANYDGKTGFRLLRNP